jgi:hypothetical protein
MNCNLRDAAYRRGTFLATAKIECALQTQAAHDRDIGVGEAAEMVGAEDLPPSHGPTIPGGIASQVTEVAGADEVEMAGRSV